MLNSNMFGEKAGFILGRVIGEQAAIFLRGLYFFSFIMVWGWDFGVGVLNWVCLGLGV